MGTTRNYISGIPLKFVKSPITAYQTINIGADADGFDFYLYSDTSGSYVQWDASTATLYFIGEASIDIGASEDGVDTTFYGDTAGVTSKWDASNDAFIFTGADIQLKDGDKLVFGDGAGVAGDIQCSFTDGTGLSIVGSAAAESLLLGSDTYALNTTLKGTLTVGKNDTGYDVTLYGASDGSSVVWDESEDDLILTASDLVFSGASGTHHINFDAVTMSHTLIGCGSYGSPVDQSTTTGFANFCSTSDDADSWRYGMGIYTKGTGTGTKLFGIGLQQEYNGTGGVDRLQCISAIALLGGGSEAARLLTLGGDATAGFYAGWFKVGANTSCVVDSGSRVAPLWIDNQMNCVCNGEEYAMFITCGGSKVDAVFGFETTSSGWTYLFHFDETAYNKDPVSSLSCATNSGASNGSLMFSLNGTTKYIPYFDAAS